MTDEGIDMDDPDVQAEAERRYNIYYRGFLDEDVPLNAGDLERLSVAFDNLTDEETKELGRLSLEIEQEGRDGLDFEEVTDTEREYFDLIHRVLSRAEPGEDTDD